LILGGVATEIVGQWGRKKNFINDKAKQILGIDFIPVEESICDMSHSLIEAG